MSIVDYVGTSPSEAGGFSTTRPPLHRLATVRRSQGVSRRTLARRMNVDVAEIRRQEKKPTICR